MTILEAVKQSNTPTLMQKGSIKAAQKMLQSNETILWAMTANISKGAIAYADFTNIKDKTNVVIVITDQRIFYVNNVLGIGSSVSIPINEIRSVEEKQQSASRYLQIQSITQRFLVDGTSKTIPPLYSAIQRALAKQTESAAAPAAGELDVEQLKKLKELFDAGILTEEEFAAKKAQILGL